jgi:hypothetical protein
MPSKLSLAGAVAALTLALAGTASADTITTGHHDIDIDVDCLAETLTVELEDDFLVTTSGGGSGTPEAAAFGTTDPISVIHESLGTGQPLVLGFHPHYDANCAPATPPVDVALDTSDPAFDVDGIAKAYDATGTSVFFDTDAVGGGAGISGLTDHFDPRWGFDTAGEYALPLVASSPGFADGGAVLQVEVQ